MSAFYKSFFQYFATGSDTASCQEYEEYEIVTHGKLQSFLNTHSQLVWVLASSAMYVNGEP